MAALTGSSTRIFARNSNSTPSSFTLLGRSDFSFSPSPKFKKLCFDHLIRTRTADARSASTLRVASETEVFSGLDDAVTGVKTIQPAKTVHLKFQLQKECKFRDHFLLVGDHIMLGLWNPLNAIPLNWSDEHVWSVELDAPIDLTMQFKFILKQETGEILWQPGPDRIFKTWESRSTIIVAEDWENSDAQKIMEEVSLQMKLTTSPELKLSMAGNVHHQRDEESLFSYDEGQILVSGSPPLQSTSNEDALSKEFGSIFNIDSSIGIDASKNQVS